MEFRPCIDIHNGKVKQIVGGSLRDAGDVAGENFVACQDAAYFADLYRRAGLKGGHIILLNSKESEYYAATRGQALEALAAYPGGLQVGGGITPATAGAYLEAGASHVIVTSYVFSDGRIRYERLREMTRAVGREHLVLDLSCRRAKDAYVIVTDRWQKMTEEKVNMSLLDGLSAYCDEFLIHAVDVEGKCEGIERELVEMLGEWDGIPVTYAGGVHNMEDLRLLRELGRGRLHVTIGSALDLFGGGMRWEDVRAFCDATQND
ncbi:MAG: phosphoribosylformimino-5-aminoimidazole carboxamide ribotide isomerase [Clostridium sp.]|nr:phosphoribosylformimino-5-aminoimidazole carboxamide ribotide isomerase [Acetatifactor muris]MCM1527419.1 phosphoribosylformimino-5-aminoimidazole carboxamide ribotide isomerase [Bacteroides sp.]MCM1562424.1 phosphoribosylformimino-5-aminoimidazole carboxamide ribotide isomerase [Clostridium sp.]